MNLKLLTLSRGHNINRWKNFFLNLILEAALHTGVMKNIYQEIVMPLNCCVLIFNVIRKSGVAIVTRNNLYLSF